MKKSSFYQATQVMTKRKASLEVSNMYQILNSTMDVEPLRGDSCMVISPIYSSMYSMAIFYMSLVTEVVSTKITYAFLSLLFKNILEICRNVSFILNRT